MKMLQALLLLGAGLAVGFAVSFWFDADPGTSTAAAPLLPASAVSSAGADLVSMARLAALEDALDLEIDQRAALEERVAELAAQLDALDRPPRSEAARATGGAARDPETLRAEARRRVAERDAASERRAIERLTAAGFAPDRAEWIVRREEQLRMQALQAQYDAAREGRALAPGEALGADRGLRAELGEADYERYLSATGRPTSVGVRGVLASSPAEASGLAPGDEIVSYGGKRVFDMRELNALTLEGRAGEPVIVEVRRDGRTLQLVLPRGPIGISSGGFRGR